MSKKLTKKKLSLIIKKVNKYHYFLVNKKKSILLGSSNSNTEAKNKVFEKLKDKIDSMIDKAIYRIKIGLSEKLNVDSYGKDLIGGPIYLKLEKYLIKRKDKLQKKESVDYLFYYKNKYLFNNNIEDSDLKKIAFAFKNNLFDHGGFKIKYVDETIKLLGGNIGNSSDFIKLFFNLDWTVNKNPKKSKSLSNLPKNFNFNQNIKKIIIIYEKDDIEEYIEYKIKNKKVNILNFLYQIYNYFKKNKIQDHIFFEGFLDENLEDNILSFNLRLGS